MRPAARRSFTQNLKYLTYRDDKNGQHIEQELNKFNRWQDRGLGQTWRQIQSACETYQSRHVLSWNLVISPSPELFSIIDKDSRHQLMADLTDSIIEAYFEARDLSVPEYAFVIHEATTKPVTRQLSFPETQEDPLERITYPFTHAHVVIPGTVLNHATDERLPFYNNADRGHIMLLHNIAESEVSTVFDQELAHERGINWRFITGRDIDSQPALSEAPAPLLPLQDLSNEPLTLDDWFPRTSILPEPAHAVNFFHDLDPGLSETQLTFDEPDFDIDD
jgi:hypothetical protein